MKYRLRRILLPALLLFLIGACERAVGDDGSNLPCMELDEVSCLERPDCLASYELGSFVECMPVPTLSCALPLSISTNDELVAALDAVVEDRWTTGNTWASGRFLLTDDLQVTSTLTVEASDFAALHPGCNPIYPDDPCEPLRFVLASTAVNADLPGVTFSGQEWRYTVTDPNITGAFPTVTLDAGTTLRLGVKVYTRGPTTPIHLIELFGPCPEICPQSTSRCPFGPLCYRTGDEYCRRCHAGPTPTCACQGSAGAEADGELCVFQQSSETAQSGVCEQGICVVDSPW